MPHVIGYDRVEHFVRVPATVGSRPGRFLVDSGIGLTIVSPATAEAVGAESLAEVFTARRMSGQAVTVPLTRLPVLEVAGVRFADHVAGVIELGQADGDHGFDGILGLDLLGDHCLTVDPVASTVSLADAAPDGILVRVEVERDGPSVAMFAPLELPSGRVVRVEVDTGSGSLILEDSLMRDCEVDSGTPGLETRTGTDETGHSYVRRFVNIPGSVRVPGLPATTQDRPRVQFQQIAYDGLLGTVFLNRFRHTFDVRGERIVLEQV